MSLGIKGKFIVGFDGEEHRILTDGIVVIADQRITHVGKSYTGDVDKWIDASRSLVIPGLINTHIHASTALKDKSFLEDTGVRELYMSNLGENLTALGLSIQQKDHEIFAKYSIAECLKSGNTTIVEIGMVGSLGAEETIKIIGDLGIRACEGPSINDGEWERTQKANIQTRWYELEEGLKKLDSAEKFIKQYKGALEGRLIPMLYPDRADTNSTELLKAVREKANELKVNINIHAAQWIVGFNNMLRMYGRTPIEFLHDTGLLGSDLIIAHGWASAGHPLLAYPPSNGGDLPLLAKSGTTVSHDPVVFAKRGNKLHSHTRYLQAGVNVSIGTDTAPQDMLNEMRFASYVSKLADWDCFSGSSQEIFNSATIGGATGIGRSDLGRIAPGALADITIIDLENFNMVPVRDPIRNLVNNAQRSDVKTVIVNGQIVVDNGKLLTMNEDQIIKQAQQAAEGIWNRISEYHYLNKTADELSPQSLKPWLD